MTATLCQAFLAPNNPSFVQTRVSANVPLYAQNNVNDLDSPIQEGGDENRRNFISSTTRNLALLGGLSVTTLSSNPLFAFADEEEATSTTSVPAPIVVIGANGKTGTECVKALAAQSTPVRATSRSGVYNDASSLSDTDKQFLETLVCDVTQPSTLPTALNGAKAVIFAASASKQGGTPAQVDNAGLINVAKACLDANVEKLVIVSSGAVTKPSSPVYLFLNLFGKIMEEKIKGEDAVRALYKNSDKKQCSYTVIRPGGLTEEPPLGVSALELNQGDTKSGRIARADVASLCVQSITYGKLTENVTFECYNKDTGAPLASVGMNNIKKGKTNPEDFVTGRECLGNTWEEIFSGLEADGVVV